jgi:hypothetical protein
MEAGRSTAAAVDSKKFIVHLTNKDNDRPDCWITAKRKGRRRL